MPLTLTVGERRVSPRDRLTAITGAVITRSMIWEEWCALNAGYSLCWMMGAIPPDLVHLVGEEGNALYILISKHDAKTGIERSIKRPCLE
jgi:hypothetical protein